MPSPSLSQDSRCYGSEIKFPNSNSVSVARASMSNSASARRAALRPICPGYLEVFLEPVWTPLPPPVSLQALSSADDICAYSLPLGDCDLPYALSKKHMSQVNCTKQSVKQLRYVPHDLSFDASGDNNELEVHCDTAASAADGSGAAPPSHVWELCYLRGTWVPYPQDTCRLLDDALASRKFGHDRLVQIKARDVGLHTPVNRHATSSRAVVVDVSAMCQVNVFTGMLHQIRRRRCSADIPSGLPACPPPLQAPFSLHHALASRIPASIFTKPHSALRVGYDPTFSPTLASSQAQIEQHNIAAAADRPVTKQDSSRMRRNLKKQQPAASDSSGSSQAERGKRSREVVVLARSSSSSSSSGAAAATSASTSSSSDAVRGSGAYAAAAGSMSAGPSGKRAKA